MSLRKIGDVMDAPVSMDRRTPQEILRGVLDLCADCEVCRNHMEEECAFFPELYRLWDQQDESGVSIPEADLRRLVERCTLCGLCPCARIPSEVMLAKSRYIDREGLLKAVSEKQNAVRDFVPHAGQTA